MIIAVAAEAMEFSGWLRRCTQVENVATPLRFARMATSGAQRVLMVANGPGPSLARQAAEAALQAAPVAPTALLSIGLCGGLDPALRIGDILLVNELETVHGRYPVQLPQRHPEAATGALLSIDRFLGTPEEKAQGFARNARAVEMEAGALPSIAAAKSLPLYAVRVVSDEAHETFALDFNEYRDADGRFQMARIGLAAVASPFRALPGVIRMARNSKLGSENLGAFLADCDF